MRVPTPEFCTTCPNRGPNIQLDMLIRSADRSEDPVLKTAAYGVFIKVDNTPCVPDGDNPFAKCPKEIAVTIGTGTLRSLGLKI